ncbi:hypothetical protein LZ32DRAFT_65821 [Colletotrichum eremochloae]|nr:hypothetical protein LZ32DRAFT_65821 [Colletotrichum eremochloae]
MCHQTGTVNLYAPRDQSFAFTEDLIGDKYRIQSRKVTDDCLDVYVVTDEDGRYFEAQAFSPITALPETREGFRNARRRRMKRICRSNNFAGEFEHGGRRFLVSNVRRNEKEWADLQAQAGGRIRNENMSRLTRSSMDSASTGISNCGSASMMIPKQNQRPSYADVAADSRHFGAGTTCSVAGRRTISLSLRGSKRAAEQ